MGIPNPHQLVGVPCSDDRKQPVDERRGVGMWVRANAVAVTDAAHDAVADRGEQCRGHVLFPAEHARHSSVLRHRIPQRSRSTAIAHLALYRTEGEVYIPPHAPCHHHRTRPLHAASGSWASARAPVALRASCAACRAGSRCPRQRDHLLSHAPPCYAVIAGRVARGPTPRDSRPGQPNAARLPNRSRAAALCRGHVLCLNTRTGRVARRADSRTGLPCASPALLPRGGVPCQRAPGTQGGGALFPAPRPLCLLTLL
jgi:hypothetical protein